MIWPVKGCFFLIRGIYSKIRVFGAFHGVFGIYNVYVLFIGVIKRCCSDMSVLTRFCV